MCTQSGTTILVVNYQHHIPHFAEGLFVLLAGLLAQQPPHQLCHPSTACRVLFHQYEQWPERGSGPNAIAWQSGALIAVIAAAFVSTGINITAVNKDLNNVNENSYKYFSCSAGTDSHSLAFERLVVLFPRTAFEVSKWFLSPHYCDAFREAAWAHYISPQTGSRTPRIGVLTRRGTRSFANLPQILDLVKERWGMSHNIITFDLEEKTFAEQVASFASLQLLIAPHGAGLTNIPFMARGSTVVEVFPYLHSPPLYFEGLALSCGMRSYALRTADPLRAVLTQECADAFPHGLPVNPAPNETSRASECGKRSGILVDLRDLGVVLDRVALK